MIAYIDASEGFKGQGKAAGVAIVYGDKYWAIPITYCGNNQAELLAYKLAIREITERPLVIVTDSLHVMKHGITKDVAVHWHKRNSTVELELADTLAKLAARNAISLSGTWKVEDILPLQQKVAAAHRKELVS